MNSSHEEIIVSTQNRKQVQDVVTQATEASVHPICKGYCTLAFKRRWEVCWGTAGTLHAYGFLSSRF